MPVTLMFPTQDCAPRSSTPTVSSSWYIGSGLFSGLGRHLGMQDVEVGFPDFDRDFVIKGNNETLLRWLFADERVRTLLAEQPEVRFEVVDDEGWFGERFPEGVDELRFQVRGVIKDVRCLKQLFELFSATLERLCALGSAYRAGPGVELNPDSS